MNKTIENGFSFIIFGGTGDLTNRKIIPAFFQLYKRKILPNNFKIIIIGRREYTQKDYYEFLYNALSKFASINNKDDFLNFAKYIIYYKMDYLNNALYPKLKQFILDI
ncbi:MAG TPA: glucose-6-phosphate dehydrogenase, partial [Bacilli bacterium]|nr:glucose-6-phosphate dehydrogenase [Bacilli bacterium]